MKKTVFFLVSLFAFMMITNIANGQMRSVAVQGSLWSDKHEDINTIRRDLPATGTSDDDYPAVGQADQGARVWTIGELKRIFPKLALSINPKYTNTKLSHFQLVKADFGKKFLLIHFKGSRVYPDKPDYSFNLELQFWCTFDEYGNIKKSGEKRINQYYAKL